MLRKEETALRRLDYLLLIINYCVATYRHSFELQVNKDYKACLYELNGYVKYLKTAESTKS